MSAVQFSALRCDECGEGSRHVEGTVLDADRALHPEGWRRAPGGHRCPACSGLRVLRNYLPGAPDGLCDCGCGQATAIAPRSRSRSGWVKGRPMPRIPGHRTPAPVRDANGCLIWQGRVDENGYGRRGARWAHRAVWEDANGPVPEGHEIDHTCHVELCVELAHLQALPEEVHDAMPKRRRTG